MGLDMYLSAKKHFAKINWQALQANDELNYNSPEAVFPQFNDLMELTQLSNVATDIYGATVEVTCAYWRKANQVHAWFVREVQKGNDNCGEYYVDIDDLKTLLELCEKVKADHSLAEELLPSASGFFFGGTDYDEWYYNGIDNTIEILKEALGDTKGDYYYSSSW
jgi:hypothetical protein